MYLDKIYVLSFWLLVFTIPFVKVTYRYNLALTIYCLGDKTTLMQCLCVKVLKFDSHHDHGGVKIAYTSLGAIQWNTVMNT